jgi:serine protease
VVKRLLIGLILSLIAICGAQTPASADLVPDEVIVTFKPGVDYSSQSKLIRTTMHLTSKRTGYQRAFWVVHVPKTSTPANLIQQLQANAQILYAEQNVTTKTTSAVDPNDLYFGMQWNLQSVGFGIGCDNAWQVSTGAGVPVAVLDTGCAYETAAPYYAAPDLNLGHIIPLSDWANGDIHPDDDNGHGTFLCTLIAGTLNNVLSGVGVAPDAVLMPTKVMDASGKGKADWMASGILEAATKGASIILMGGGTKELSRPIQDAINVARQYGAKVIMGAGNEGVDLDLHPEAHAIYANTLVVGATTRGGQLAAYSNYGSAVKLLAPGGDYADPIWAQTLSVSDPGVPRFGFPKGGQSINNMIGTSMAAAHVAGVMALVMTTGRSLDLASTGRTLSLVLGGQTRNFTLIDAARAVGFRAGSSGGSGGGGGGGGGPAAVHDVGVTQFAGPTSGTAIGGHGTVQVQVTNLGSVHEDVTVSVHDDTGNVSLDSQTASLDSGQSVTLNFDWTATAPLGTHTLTAEAHLSSDIDLTNNVKTTTVQVLAQPLTLAIASYDPIATDQAHGTPKASFQGGSLIGLEFNVTDSGVVAGGATVSYTVVGASGATVTTGTATTDGGGRTTAVLSFYYIAGGPGTYRVDATATRNGKTATGTYTFQVTSVRSGR